MIINLFELKRNICNVQLNQNDSYLLSYPHFIDYFKQKDKLTKKDLICGVFMVYGWMPTILKRNDCNYEIIEILNFVKNNNDVLSEDNLRKLLPFANKSMVGLSKLLHFINPEVYPIWDRKICKYFYSTSHNYQIQNVSNYLKYTNAIHKALEFELPEEFNLIKKQLDYNISDIRLIEISIFYTV